MVWELRRAGVDDLDSIMPFETGTFGSDAWSRNSMRSELANPQCYYLLAFPPEDSHQVEGYAGLFSPDGAPAADVQTIAVDEVARRRGLGRLLLQCLISEARNRGAVEIFLEVRADNPSAQALYSSLGFAQIAVRLAYYQPDGVDALVMRLTVEPLKAGLA